MTKLFAVHNLFEDKLHFANKIGGLACPSLAIIRGDLPYDNYGPITLVANSKMINPSKNQVFNSDVYSPRFPNTFYESNDKNLKIAMNKFKAAMQETNDIVSIYSVASSIEQNGTKGFSNALRNEHAVKITFLREKGISVNVPMKAPSLRNHSSNDTRVQKWFSNNNIHKLGWDSPKFLEIGEIIREIIEEESKMEAERYAQDRKEGESYQEVFDDVFGFVYETKIQSLESTPSGFKPTIVTSCEISDDIDTIKNSNRIVDRVKFNDVYQPQLEKYESEYESWLFNLGKDIPELPWFYDSNNNKLPVTIDAVVKDMRKTVRDGENCSYGAGQIRAIVAKQFETFQDIDDCSIQLSSKKELEDEKEIVSEMLNEIADLLKPYYRFDSEKMGFMDIVSTSIKDYIKKGKSEIYEHYNEMPEDIFEKIDYFVDYLRDARTTYFEAKFDRAVKLNEFEVAIIPDNLSEDTIKLLKENGLQVIEYKSDNNISRISALHKVKALGFGEYTLPSIDKTDENIFTI
jgi:hypothetical protein